MKQTVNYNSEADRVLDILSRGAFLTAKHNDKTNAMTIGWGSISFAWGKPVFMAMIRHSRFTHSLVEASREFTVSIPYADAGQALGLCGSRSGRDIDKIAAAKLTLLPGEKVAAPVIDIPGMHYECKVVFQQDMQPETTAEEVKNKWYANGDFHTLYFGEIVASYVIK